MNYAKDRIENDFDATFPSEDVVCKDCRYRMKGVLGARNAYCDIFTQPVGKPNDILFKNANCAFHEKENGTH